MVPPIPDPTYFDLSIIILLTLFFLFDFAFGLIFLRVVIKVAPVLLVPRLKI